MIKLSNITKVFQQGSRTITALSDVTLHVPAGQIYGVIGSSGAGKSTLIRCANMLERPTSGQVLVDGQDLTSLSESELTRARRQIGMIFQHFNLLSSRTVFGNVALPLELDNMPRAGSKARDRTAGAGRPGGQARRLPGQPVRRPETARGDRPCAGQQSQSAAVRRSHQRVGSGHHPFHPGTAERHQPPSGPDHSTHHPRNGRGETHLRPGRGHQPGATDRKDSVSEVFSHPKTRWPNSSFSPRCIWIFRTTTPHACRRNVRATASRCCAWNSPASRSMRRCCLKPLAAST